MDDEVENVVAETWAKQLASGRGGVGGRARRSMAELTETMAEGNGRLWWSGRRV